MGYVVCDMWGLVERLVPKDRTGVGAIHELPLQAKLKPNPQPLNPNSTLMNTDSY
jgi:hypothetical protein